MPSVMYCTPHDLMHAPSDTSLWDDTRPSAREYGDEDSAYSIASASIRTVRAKPHRALDVPYPCPECLSELGKSQRP
jgi:hypothetical protein